MPTRTGRKRIKYDNTKSWQVCGAITHTLLLGMCNGVAAFEKSLAAYKVKHTLSSYTTISLSHRNVRAGTIFLNFSSL